MSKPLSLTNSLLADIEMALNDNSYEMQWYLDTREEKTAFLCDPAYTGEYEENEKLEQLIEQDEEGRFIPIPDRTSREGWEQMKKFILSLDNQDEKIQNLLLNTIQGKGAFGRFKDAMLEIDMLDQWYEYKNRQDRRETLRWLRSENLITGEQVEEGLRMFEEQLQRKKRRKMEMANMTKGRRVRCTHTTGHSNSLTEGKKYEVRDEQEQHQNIRIQDDRGKLVWMPKSHFELV